MNAPTSSPTAPLHSKWSLILASSAMIERMRRVLPYVNRISGAVMVIVGLYVAWYGWFELRLFGSSTVVDDPVIAGARRIQGALAGWVYSHGAWPWLIALGVVAAAAAWGWVRRRRSVQQDQARLESSV